MVTFPIRVLVVDDSAYLRKVLTEMLMRSPRIEVVGAARNGQDALEKVAELSPDVVTLDLYMDNMTGVEFLRKQMALRPLPVVVCSVASQLGDEVVAAMEAGAVEFVQKPTALSSEQVYEIGEELVQKVLAAASIPPEKLVPFAYPKESPLQTSIPRKGVVDAIVIGVSTGGPKALRYLLPLLPADIPASIAIVLHMPVGYTGPLAQKLNEISLIEVSEAREGMELYPGCAILGQAGYHFFLRRAGPRVVAHLDSSPLDAPHCPSVDFLFRSAAEVYGARTLGIVLTGMGSDGTNGAAWIKSQGGLVFSEAESTSVIYGMPRSVVEAGLSDRIVPLHLMAQTIMEVV